MTVDPSVVRLATPLIGEAEHAAVRRVLKRCLIAGCRGGRVRARLCPSRCGTPLRSGQFRNLRPTCSPHKPGFEPGSEVIVPSFSFAATANAVRLAGCEPVFVDIEPEYYCVSASAVEDAISSRTSAVMPVHLYGHPAAMTELAAMAGRHGLALVEDAAQAHGAELNGAAVGTFGDAAAFSFYPTKNMTTGEGGMVVDRDASRVRAARLLRNQGMETPYENETVGMNLRMPEMAAALGLVQLGRLSDLNNQRVANAQRITDALRGTELVPPGVATGARHVYHQYTVRTTRQAALIRHLDRAGVESRVYYRTPVHRLPPFATGEQLPETERACAEVVSLPVGPHLADSDLDRVCDALSRFG